MLWTIAKGKRAEGQRRQSAEYEDRRRQLKDCMTGRVAGARGVAFADMGTSVAGDIDGDHMEAEVLSRVDEGDGNPYTLEESAYWEESKRKGDRAVCEEVVAQAAAHEAAGADDGSSCPDDAA